MSLCAIGARGAGKCQNFDSFFEERKISQNGKGLDKPI